MRVLRLVCLAAAVTLVVSSCGSSKEDEAAKAAQQAAQKAAGGATAAAGDATAAAKGLTDFAKSMEEAGKALSSMGGDGKPVEPVSFRELQKYLPQVSGWTMGQPEGQKMTAPFPFAESEVSYTKGDASINVKIVDSGFNQIVFAPFTMLMVQGYEKETSSGYEKGVTVAGVPGFEKWDSGDKSGELTLAVGKRFLVSLNGRGIGDMSELRDFAAQMNLAGLSGLK